MSGHRDDKSAENIACVDSDVHYAGSVRRDYWTQLASTQPVGGRAGAEPVRLRHSQSRQQWQHVVNSCHCLLAYTTEYIVEHRVGDIDARWCNAVAELHRGIDLIDQ